MAYVKIVGTQWVTSEREVKRKETKNTKKWVVEYQSDAYLLLECGHIKSRLADNQKPPKFKTECYKCGRLDMDNRE